MWRMTKANALRIPRTGPVIFLFVMIGITIFGLILTQQERAHKTQDLIDRGNYLVSLISLHPMKDFQGEKRNFFLRTLTEYTSYEGLVYCFVHDREGRSIVSLVPNDLNSRLPDTIRSESLNAMGLTKQSFKINGSKNTFYEFSKAIFEEGHRTGTVRLGFTLPSIALFSLERTRFLAMIAFFIFAIVLFFHYGITVTLKPLKKLNQDIRNSCAGSELPVSNPTKSDGVAFMVNDLEQSLAQIREKLGKIEKDNVTLASRLGILTFEKKQIAQILNLINLGIIITDIHDNINHINKYMLKLLKKNIQDIAGRPLSQVLSHRGILSFISKQEALKQKKTVAHFETTFPKLAPGDIFSVSVSNLNHSESGLIGKMIVIKKITNQKMAEKAQRDFIAHIAHELKTPLTSIKAYSEMLLDGDIDDREMKKEFYNTINDEVGRLSSLVHNLLSMSKMEMGGLTLNKDLVKSDWLVKDSMAAIEPAARSKQITIDKNLPEVFPSLVGDKELLKIGIINILNNAVKYTPEAGKIAFSLHDQDGHVIFDISDTGYGISQEDLPRIFDKSYRSSDPNIKNQTGSGLGLAITSEIIQLHGGEIEVESEPGMGTHFRVKIPKGEYYLGQK